MTFIPADEDGFFLQVSQALSGCQLVEQELKLYIAEALALIRKLVAGRVPFSMSVDDYQEASLERLVGAFKKFSDDASLLKRLNQFKDERNFLSHRAITHCMDAEQGLSYPSVLELQPRLSAMAAEAESLRHAIHEAANSFRASVF